MTIDSEEPSFKKTALNTVNRYRNRGVYDYKTVHDIIDKTPLLNISFSPTAAPGEGNEKEAWYPVILPMLGCTGVFEDRNGGISEGPRSIYLHGYVSCRLIKLTEGGDQGIPVCVAATLLDGLVLALTPNHHGCNYRSAVVYGHAHVVTEEEERLWAMELIMDNLVPGRWGATRYPNDGELRRTGILRIDIDSASAKVRTGTTGEDRGDLKDEEMRRRVWAGVIPAHTVWGEPVPAPTNLMEPPPRYLDDWRIQETEEARDYAYSVAQ
ncbi:5-nitroimidazole antibiotic resistance protein [Xylariales sp. PMI_506]|nr:5-nitroimidazole antibiotic resistance protein [Xylariales sp. PMI_506]